MKTKKVEDSRTQMTQLVMPNDANPLGNLMGGALMNWMDIAAAICAGKHCESHVVTVSVDHVSFHLPIKVGDVVTLNTQVTRAFNTSLEIFVEVFAQNIKGHEARKSNHAYFTFVAVDDVSGKPVRISPVTPLTQQEEKLYESAIRRREVRLILGGRMKPSEAKDLKSYFSEL